MNVLLVDDHPMVRESIALYLEQSFPSVQIFQANDCTEALLIAHKVELNLVLLDIEFSIGGREGIDALVDLKAAFDSLCVVIFSGIADNRELVFESLRKGAMGFIPKTLTRQTFIEALKDVLSGRPYLPACVIRSEETAAAPGADLEKNHREITDHNQLGLTKREFDVLRWVVHGKANKVIAQKLGKSPQTVKNHLRPIFTRFNVDSRSELIVAVFKLGIVLGEPEAGNGSN
jgi:DNA-binding NarL/FixJ family response regulator